MYDSVVLQTDRLELGSLLFKYKFERIDEWFPRSKTVPCSNCNGINCQYCDTCSGQGTEEARIDWVNAQAAYAALVDSQTVVIADFGNWFNVTVLLGEVRLSPMLKIMTEYGSLYASSGSYDGGQAGSAIYNPDKLRGFCYRTCMVDNVGIHGDAYCYPHDIVSHLLDLSSDAKLISEPFPFFSEGEVVELATNSQTKKDVWTDDDDRQEAWDAMLFALETVDSLDESIVARTVRRAISLAKAYEASQKTK